MSTTTDPADSTVVAAMGKTFLDRLAARDFAGLAATLTTDAHARFLLPRGFEEYEGRDAAVNRIQTWFGSASKFELASSSEEPVGSRHRMTWRFNVEREGRAEVIEQVVYLDLGPTGIHQIDLLCSGFHQTAAAADSVTSFDAGTMGCADGLAEEFRRRLADVPVGGVIEVVVRDPAAKEDLPSLARMLGQRISSTRATADGRLIIAVERKG
jgi:TusA-related sulfurtransferase